MRVVCYNYFIFIWRICFRNLNDSFVVIVVANKNYIRTVLESSMNVRVLHFIIIPLDGPLPPRPGIFKMSTI